ncbi:MAG: amino-acid N-acetyltransferase [Treponema sp.]|nr:amino-acid N-acetyltransferase [Treponema sp.]
MNPAMDLIREAFHYQSRFAGSTMVFKIDFPVTAEGSFPSLIKDLALLARTGFRVVIVPGAKEWIDLVLAENSIVSRYAPSAAHGQIRITGEGAMPFVEMASFHVATRFMTALSANHCDSVIGNFVRARGLGVLKGIDMENTGRVEKILTKPIRKILNSEMAVILPCIGWGASGKPYNVPSDEIALAAAESLGAVKLFVVSAEKNLLALRLPPDQSKKPAAKIAERIIRLKPKEAEAILKLNKAEMGKGKDPAAARALAELRLALGASKAGVERIHIIDGREEGAVLRELFSNLGSGTMVYADEYEAIRPLKTQDIPDLLRIMEPLMQQGILVNRSAEEILEKKDDYWVLGIDGQAHACGALHQWKEQGEIAAVVVDSAYADMGLGSRIVRFLINKASGKGLRQVFALTTQTQDWFETLGFKEVGPEILPEERKKTCHRKRKSKIYALELR